jgi:hypothetical protein
MSDNRKLIIQEAIIGAVKDLLKGRVNEILLDDEFEVPIIEFGNYQDGGCYPTDSLVAPVIALLSCEKTEKERIIRLDAFSLTITFSLPEKIEAESQCYAYCAAVCMALKENPTLGGVVDRAVITGEKYVPPKTRNCGQNWEVVISVRVTVEGLA